MELKHLQGGKTFQCPPYQSKEHRLRSRMKTDEQNTGFCEDKVNTKFIFLSGNND